MHCHTHSHPKQLQQGQLVSRPTQNLLMSLGGLKFTGCVSSVALMSSRHILIVLSASHVTSLQGAQHTQENIPQELDNHRNITSTKNC